LILMNMTTEYLKAREWVEKQSFDIDATFDTFETIIRVVGGLVSAYDLTNDALFLNKAVVVGNKILKAFAHGGAPFPATRSSFSSSDSQSHPSLDEAVNLAQLGSNYVEFFKLSKHARDPIYQIKAQNVFDYMFNVVRSKATSLPGLYPQIFNLRGYALSTITSLGAQNDSFYEYLLKGWLIGGKNDMKLRKEYDRSVDAALTYLAVPLDKNDMSKATRFYFGSMGSLTVNPRLEHLTCFAGGMLGLGAVSKLSPYSNRVFELAQGFTELCADLYLKNATPLSSEVAHMPDFNTVVNGYLQRPEVLESIFYMWRLTHDQKYREWAKTIMQVCLYQI